jgi:hypothetical protein
MAVIGKGRYQHPYSSTPVRCRTVFDDDDVDDYYYC